MPYVAVDEARRSRFGRRLDQEPRLHRLAGRAAFVAGRRQGTPLSLGGEQKQYWKNWSTRDDLVSLARWERLFGERFGSLFVFAYNVVGELAPLPREQLFEFRGGLYGFVGIRASVYATARSHDIARGGTRWPCPPRGFANWR